MYEADLVNDAKRILESSRAKGKSLPLPMDVVVAKSLAPNQDVMTVSVDNVPEGQMILDIGSGTLDIYKSLCQDAATIVWNGPVGAFEVEPFGQGTKELGEILASSSAFVIVGGGDSVAAVELYGIDNKMDYISTGGGASLELLQGEVLPAVAALNSVSI